MFWDFDNAVSFIPIHAVYESCAPLVFFTPLPVSLIALFIMHLCINSFLLKYHLAFSSLPNIAYSIFIVFLLLCVGPLIHSSVCSIDHDITMMTL